MEAEKINKKGIIHVHMAIYGVTVPFIVILQPPFEYWFLGSYGSYGRLLDSQQNLFVL